ncbi:MAG TPA: hypothetical protein ENK91_05820, partial [Bacteroidetes bacterium]|nr:hypothetical protein [Bacteroidota bacterium]
KRSHLQIKIAGVKRMFMWHFLNKPLGLILVSEFPKSGGSWFCNMLSEATNVPFPRNVSPKFSKSVMHGHFLYHKNFNKVVCVMRDGRDIMVSAYFHFLFEHNINPSFSVKIWRDRLPFEDYNDIEKNLPEFIRYMFTKYKFGGKYVSWSKFVHDYNENPNCHIVKYEDLLKAPEDELQKTIDFLGLPIVNPEKLAKIVENYSFKKLTNRKPGEEDTKSFIRKGIAGDWKNKFSLEAKKTFAEYAGDELIAMGYEKDNSWVK